MASERAKSRSKRSAVRRAWLFCLFLSLPGLLFAGILGWQHGITTASAILAGISLLLYFLLITAALIEGLVRPLQTLSNVVSSLREGDYSFRARGAGARDPYGELATEVNSLADLLQGQRVRSLEATALLARILEVMHSPLFAFDREDVLQLVNEAGTKFLGIPHARCYGRTARDLGLVDLLAAPDHSIQTFGSGASRWLLRKATFRQEGVPHTLLLLADVSRTLQEEEQTAWKRLIRVLGHELSNSLAPIKSIAGSLLARVETLTNDPDEQHDFRRGLGVVESRADSLHRFVQSYRTLAQLPRPNLQEIDLVSLLERVAMLERRVPVEMVVGAPVKILADPDQIEQMLINLLTNAADASLANGSQPIRFIWRVSESVVSVVIEDRGQGIANTENLFVPFYTTKPRGSGVGLALAQQIARAHGGEIKLVNREDGMGARATVQLPLA
ncbi:MAG TPA: ATP-binding protein [Terracidiphilus sp.]|jgi:nitrogen fixation/metabolism regulation signal transduction histidine kinase|nr:ATP-binding protein [Terracidiphilus sp.]